MPRCTTAYASKFNRTRPVECAFPRGEVFTLAADFNGAFASGVTVTAATWRVMNNGSVILGTAAITGRKATIGVTMGWGAGSVVKCLVTGSDGTKFSQLFAIECLPAPFFQGETVPAAGDYSVTVP